MRAALLALAVAAPVAAQPAAPVRIALRAEPRDCYVQQLVHLRLLLAVDEASLRERMLQMFQQELDLPVKLATHDFARDARFLTRGDWTPAAGTGAGRTFALGDRIVRAPARLVEQAGGRRELVVELSLALLPQQPGRILLPAPTAAFAQATRFEEDFARGRIALDRQDLTASGEPLELDVAALPPPPPGFTNAVGTFTVAAELLPRNGATLPLVLTIRGEGNFETLAAPLLDDLAGFHVLGRIDLRSGTQCTFRYELQPRGPQSGELPAIRFPFFAPAPPAGYREAQTEPLPMPALGAAPVQPAAGEPLRGPRPVRADAPAAAEAAWLAWLALLGPWVLAGGLAWSVQARRRSAQIDPAVLRARQAASLLAQRLAGPDADAHSACVEYLAARLQLATEVVTGPALARRLAGAGVPATLVARTTQVLGTLDAARYGGSAPERAAADVRELAAELERALAAAEAPA